MHIEEYKFGSITIDGKIYEHDVEIRWALKESLRDPTGQVGEVLSWQRGQSHFIDVEDVKRAIEQNPDTIIIGAGEAGLAQVTEGAQKFIRDKNVELIIDSTEQSIKTFNIRKEKFEKVIGLFHLTC